MGDLFLAGSCFGLGFGLWAGVGVYIALWGLSRVEDRRWP